MGVYRCPVCGGKGVVAQDFYNLNPVPTSAGSIPVTCKSCGGRGIVFDSIESFSKPVQVQNDAKGIPNPSSSQPILDDGYLGKVGL